MTGMESGWSAGPDGWFMVPEGAIVRPSLGMVVISDLHLGYEQSRGADYLPQTSEIEIRKRLTRLFDRFATRTLVVAGDVVESRAALFGRRSVLDDFIEWVIGQGVEPVLLAGNHDPVDDVRFVDHLVVEGWLIHHGHRRMGLKKHGAKGWVVGHWHPALHWRGRSYRAFLSSAEGLVLPAFTSDASGVDVAAAVSFQAGSWAGFRCHVCMSGGILDFGLLGELSGRLALK